MVYLDSWFVAVVVVVVVVVLSPIRVLHFLHSGPGPEKGVEKNSYKDNKQSFQNIVKQ